MTGITTTPHLHFQIDTSDAPFHSYWPYSFKDLRELGLDFFEAVNVGLGKENAMKYTVSPLAFVQSLARGNTAPIPQSVSASTLVNQIQVAALPAPSTQQQFITAVPVAVLPTPVKSTQTSLPALTSAPVLPEFIISPALPATPVKISSTYIDLRAGSSLARAANYLKANSVPALQGESVFRPSQSMTRREAILYLAGVFSVETQ